MYTISIIVIIIIILLIIADVYVCPVKLRRIIFPLLFFFCRLCGPDKLTNFNIYPR